VTTVRAMVHVAILDDHPAVLAGLRRLIDAHPDLAVVAAAPTAAELATLLDAAMTRLDESATQDTKAALEGMSVPTHGGTNQAAGSPCWRDAGRRTRAYRRP
jgi:hypothetical protein